MEGFKATKGLSYIGILLLFAIFLVSLSFRVWLLDKRWINPDEGPHLMDALLTLQGNVPGVDFESRQPLYTYVNAVVLKFFGISYVAGRLQPVTSSMLTGLMIFLIAKELFDEKVALLAAGMFWMLPLEALNSVVVKTEPLVVLLTCLSVYAAIRFLRSNHKLWLIASGGAAALGYYVRESSLIIPPMVFGTLLVWHGKRVGEAAKGLGLFLGGYVGVILCVMALYWKFMSPGTLLISSLNPFAFLARSYATLVAYPVAPVELMKATGVPYDSGSWALYEHYVQEAFSLHSFLMIGLVFSIVAFGRELFEQNGETISRPNLKAYALLYLWVFFLSIAYGYQYFTEGFYIDYFREFLPPLVIIFSAWLGSSVLAIQRESGLVKLILGGLCLSGIWFVLAPQVKIEGSAGYLASIAITLFILVRFAGAFNSLFRQAVFVSIFLGILALVLVSRQAPLKPYFAGTLPSLILIGTVYGLAWVLLEKTARPSWKRCPMVVAFSLVVASFVFSINASALRLTRTYDSIWSPQSVDQMAAYLLAKTGEDDEVMSGGVIWELQALRRPFHNISHPLIFGEGEISEEKIAAVTLAATRRPPKVIILDGYTEKTYMRVLPRLRELLDTRYELGIASGPAMFPVVGYQLKEISATTRPAM